MKIKNHCKVDIKGLEMGKELEVLKSMLSINSVQMELLELFEYGLLDDVKEAIAELEEAMKPKTCDACKFLNGVICKHDRGLYCVRQFEEDYFQQKDNQ